MCSCLSVCGEKAELVSVPKIKLWKARKYRNNHEENRLEKINLASGLILIFIPLHR